MSIIQGNAKTGASRGFYPKEIAGSLRFNDDDSADLSRTFTSEGDRTKWTWSAWVKRANISLSEEATLFSSHFGASTSGSFSFRFDTDDTLEVVQYTTVRRKTNAVYRDTSAWYHIVLQVDTNGDFFTIWVNGEQVTSFSTSSNPSVGSNVGVNYSTQHTIGRNDAAVNKFFDGYLAEVHFLNGIAATADNFGETKSGIWVAKAYTGEHDSAAQITAGTTNGFYLDFADSAAIGDDESGNGNDWTPNNFTASDVVLDSPTDNFPTLNPLSLGSQTLDNGNLEVVGSTTAWSHARATQSPATGKWYCETTIIFENDGATDRIGVGVINIDTLTLANLAPTEYLGETADSWAYFENGTVYNSGANTGTTTTYTTGDVIGMALDLDSATQTITWYKNNTEIVQKNLADGRWTFGVTTYHIGEGAINFGQQTFAYTPPTDYLALSTANLPDPSIDPAEDETPDDYFNTVLYTGDGTAIGSGGKAVTGVGFQPDWVWIKNRDATDSHSWYDVVRGVTKQLECDNSAVQTTEAESLTTFGADGFTLGSLAQVNTNTEDYASWSWKAGGSGSTIAAGSIDGTNPTIASTVSASQKAGISIVKWTGNATTNATVDHGLDAKPKVAIIKNMGQTITWQVNIAAEVDGTAKYIRLDLSDHAYTLAGYLTVIGDQTFTFTGTSDATRQYNNRTQDYIAYCFTDVEGYSRIGSYKGNNTADNVFVYTGFRPAWIMIKNIDLSATGSWAVWDTKRNTFNVSNTILSPDTTAADSSTDVTNSIDILSNGFKVRGATSLTGDAVNYLYMAFAEQPFKYSNAR